MVARWEPKPITEVNAPGERSPEALVQVLEALGVETDPRYRAEGPRTWCNIANWDATRALGCEVPHWIGLDGAPAKVGMGRELNANGSILWLRAMGPRYGWRKAPEHLARVLAGEGKPVIVAWENKAGGSGHVAMLLPPAGPGAALEIWQAGKTNFRRAPLVRGFGPRPVEFFAHD